MRIRKKAVIFTLISAILAALFIAVFSVDFQAVSSSRMPAANTRVKVIDTYVKNFELYSQDSLKIAAYRALSSTYSIALGQGGFYADEAAFNRTFFNCIKCGRKNCSSAGNACPAPIAGSDMESMLRNISTLAKSNLNINTQFSVDSVHLYQEYPFEVEIEMLISYNISDNTSYSYASWSKHKFVHETVSIEGLLDPTAGLSTNGANRKPIYETFLCQYNESCWDVANTRSFYNSQAFRSYENGTSYLSRFWNSAAPSPCCGLESLRDVSYSSGNISYIDRYYVNNLYNCTTQSSPKIYQVDDIAPGFKLDEASAVRYGVKNVSVLVCPILP